MKQESETRQVPRDEHTDRCMCVARLSGERRVLTSNKCVTVKGDHLVTKETG
jgi:hypothetical protein